MNAINNGKLDGWPAHLKTAYVDSGSNVDPVFEAQLMLKHLVEDTGKSEEVCVAKLKELEFTDQMIKGTIGALSGGWQMKLRLLRAVLMDPDIYLMGMFYFFALSQLSARFNELTRRTLALCTFRRTDKPSCSWRCPVADRLPQWLDRANCAVRFSRR